MTISDDADKETLGIDMSKDSFVARWHRAGKRRTYANRPDAIARFVGELLDGPPIARIVLEPTGGYERPLVAALRTAGLPTELVHSSQVRAFAQLTGLRAKSDPLDADLLAAYGATALPITLRRPRIVLPPDPRQDELRDLHARQAQLKALLHAEQCRRGQAAEPRVKAFIEESIAFLDGQLRAIQKLIDAVVHSHADMADKQRLLTSLKGVGRVTANTLIAGMPELGRIHGKQAASLIGVAPFNRDSGKRQGKARIQHGRDAVRHTLYMAALTASRHNDLLKRFYERLLADGKPRKLALVAVMRRMIVILNAILKTNQPWRGACHA